MVLLWKLFLFLLWFGGFETWEMRNKRKAKPRAWQIQRRIDRKGVSPESTYVAQYLQLRQGIRPATAWEIMFNMTSFASTVLGYDSVLDFVLPLEKDARRRTKNPWVPENMPKIMSPHETEALMNACRDLEKSLQDSGICCKSFMGWKSPEKRTLLKYIRFCRLVCCMEAGRERLKTREHQEEVLRKVQSTMNKVGRSREQVFDVGTILASEKNFPMGTSFGGRAAKRASRKAKPIAASLLDGRGDNNNEGTAGKFVEAEVDVAQTNEGTPEAPTTDALARPQPEFDDEDDDNNDDNNGNNNEDDYDEDDESDVKIGWCGAIGSDECDDEPSDYNTDEDEDYLPSSVAAPPPKKPKSVAAGKKRVYEQGVINEAQQRMREELRRQKVEMHRQKTANPEKIKKSQAIPRFVDVMKMWRPNTLLYGGESTQAICFEELKDGEVGTPGLSWKRDIAKVLAFWILRMSSSGFYLFGRSHETYHGEIETRRIGEEPSELEEVIQFGQENGVEVHVIPDTGCSMRNHFLKVAHHDSTIYKHLAEDMKLDPVWMVKKLLEMRENKNPYVKVDEERGTLNIALGFTHKGFNHDFLPDETDTTAPMTVMMYVHDKDVQELYVGVSGVADAGTKFAKFYASQDGNVYYGDDFRTSVAGVILRNLMGALHSCFEGITIAVTILGTISGGIKKLWKLLRHGDGPNDKRKGYDITVIFWVIVVIDGVIYRLSIIMYSRKSVGEAVAKETNFMQPMKEILAEYEKTTFKYNNIHVSRLGDLEAYKIGAGPTFKIYKVRSFANPMGYYSCAINIITRLREEYNLQYDRVLQLVYLACLMNCLPYFYYILRQWCCDKDGLPVDHSGNVCGDNFVLKFVKDCAAIEATPGMGKHPRFTFSQGKLLSMECEGSHLSDEAVSLEVGKLASIIKEANNGATHCETTQRLEAEIRGVGAVTALSFHSICVHVGLLYTPHALKESFSAEISTGSAFGAKLMELGCEKTYFPNALKRFAYVRGEPEFHTENLGCKACRHRNTFDVVFPYEPVHDRVMVKRNGVDVPILLKKLPEEEEWAEYVVTPVVP